MRCSTRRASPGCCGRPTTPRSPTCGRWARTSTRSRRAGAARSRRCLHSPRQPPPCRRLKPSRWPRPCPPARWNRSPRSPGTAGAGAGRDNGVRFGVRFRRGSRGALRTAEYPAHRRGPDGRAARGRRAGGRRGRTAEPEAEAPSPRGPAARRGRRRAPRARRRRSRRRPTLPPRLRRRKRRPRRPRPPSDPGARARKKAE